MCTFISGISYLQIATFLWNHNNITDSVHANQNKMSDLIWEENEDTVVMTSKAQQTAIRLGAGVFHGVYRYNTCSYI
jgi:hypothetical protein